MDGFDVIPAIDLKGGSLAALTAGDPSTLRALRGDPLVAARAFVEAGARWIHVVDLDAATSGQPANLGLVSSIAAMDVRVQAGGGLDAEGVRRALDAGADRAVLGAGMVARPGEAADVITANPGRVGLAVDVRDGMIAPRAQEPTGLSLEQAIAIISGCHPAFLTFTESGRDGSLAGPNAPGAVALRERTGLLVIASGGVRSVADVIALARHAPKLAGVIVGRALHEGRVDLREALAAVAALQPS